MTATTETLIPAQVKPASLTEVHKFFQGSDSKYNLAAFRADWAQLTDKDKTDLRTGLGNGTMTY